VTRIAIRPVDATLDWPVAIAVTAVRPGSRVRVRLRNDSLKAESSADFMANEAGVVDLAAQAPIAGDYQGLEPAGLFWSARFDPGSDVVSMIAALSRLEPMAYTATVNVDDGADVSTTFTRRLMATRIRRGRRPVAARATGSG
jgi:hypothetical protein